MAFIEWDDSLSVNVAEIDAQHKHEVELLNKLYAAKGEDVKTVFAELAEHTAMHFETEEKYFDQFNYENSAEHKEIHKKFIAKAAEVGKDIEAGNTPSEETLEFIKEWLIDHINLEDKKYTECFNENGLN